MKISNKTHYNTRTLRNRWNIWGLQWLESLEDMNANAESPEEELTTFERNLMEQLRTMVVRPEDE